MNAQAGGSMNDSCLSSKMLPHKARKLHDLDICACTHLFRARWCEDTVVSVVSKLGGRRWRVCVAE